MPKGCTVSELILNWNRPNGLAVTAEKEFDNEMYERFTALKSVNIFKDDCLLACCAL
jgi:hypothetical protein